MSETDLASSPSTSVLSRLPVLILRVCNCFLALVMTWFHFDMKQPIVCNSAVGADGKYVSQKQKESCVFSTLQSLLFNPQRNEQRC